MNQNEFRKLKAENLSNWKERYKTSLEEAWKLKREIYSIKELTETQQDTLWEMLVELCHDIAD